MEQADDLKYLISFLASEGIELSPPHQKKLFIYHRALVRYTKKHNIISSKDISHIVNKHFISSFCFVKEIRKEIKEKDQILDLGSGAGFPGIILAIFFGDNRVTMVDSIRKKTLFLKRVSDEIGVKTMIINERIENYFRVADNEAKFITARALASIDTLVELTRQQLKTSVLHTIKGNNFSTEVDKYESKINIISFEIEQNWKQYSAYLSNKVYLTISSSL